MRSALLVGSLLALLVSSTSAADNPLQPLVAVGKRLDEGLAAFLGGKSLKESFAPWTVEEESPDETARLRERMKRANVATLQHVGINLGVCLVRQDRVVYVCNAGVWGEQGGAVLVGLGGRVVSPTEEPPLSTESCRSESEFKGQSLPFVEAARKVRDAFSGEGWRTIPWVSRARIQTLYEGCVLRDDILKQLDEQKNEAPSIAKAVSGSAPDGLRIRVGSVEGVGLDAAGKYAGTAFLTLKVGKDGGIVFRLNSFTR